MSQSLTFRMLTIQDTPQVVKLLNATFRVLITAQEWEWFVFGNPDGPSRVYLALDEQQTIVGTCGFSPILLRINGELIKASFGHHLALKPGYRDGTSFIRLSRYYLAGEAAEGVKLTIGPPNRNAYKPHKVLMNWTDFGYLDCLYKLSPEPRKHNCQVIDSFAGEFDTFYAFIEERFNFIFHKTAQRMNWRFRDKPGKPYTTYVYYDGGKLCGYIVLKRWQESDGYREAHIMDMQALTDSALDELLVAAESYAADCDQLDLWYVIGYPYRAKLEERGFVFRESERRPIIVRTFDGSSPSFPVGPASFMYGDGDQY